MPYFRAARRHADEFERAKIRRQEGKTADPRGDGASREKEVRACAHVAAEREADADHKADVNQHDGVIDGMKIHDEGVECCIGNFKPANGTECYRNNQQRQGKLTAAPRIPRCDPPLAARWSRLAAADRSARPWQFSPASVGV